MRKSWRKVGNALRFALVVASLAKASFSHDSDYVFRELKSRGNIQPQAGNTMIQPLPGAIYLMPATGPLNPGGFHLRRKFKGGTGFEYILFKGSVASDCYKGLSFFRVDSLDSRQAALQKFYPNEDADYYGDFDDIYLQDSLVLAPSISLYFRRQGRWHQARRLEPPYGCLQIATDPPGTQVYLEKRAAGVSPLFLSGLASGLADLRLAKAGFLPIAHQATILPGKLRKESYRLTPVPHREGTNLDSLLKPDGAGPGIYAVRETAVQQSRDSIKVMRDSVLARFDRDFPAFAESAGENGERRNARLGRYRNDRGHQRKRIEAGWDSTLQRHHAALDSLRRMRERKECELVVLELPGDQLSLQDYDPEFQYRPFSLELKREGFWFAYRGGIRLSPVENQKLDQDRRNALVRLTYRRIPQPEPRGGSYYFTFSGFQIKMDTLLRLDESGAFRYPREIWRAEDSVHMAGRMRACMDQPLAAVERPGRKNWMIASGLAAGGLLAGGTLYLMLQGEGPREKKKVVVITEPDK